MKFLVTIILMLSIGVLAQTPISASFFGVQQSHLTGCDGSPLNYPFNNLPVGDVRLFAACGVTWKGMNSAVSTFDFSKLDIYLATAKTSGLNDVFVTLGYTPNWISSNATDTLCDAAGQFGNPNGMCDPPSDLNADGTGTDLAWRTFLTNMLNHVTAGGYSSTHAHIAYYEIWNEFHRSDTVGGVTVLNGTVNTTSAANSVVTWVSGSQWPNAVANDIITITGTTCTPCTVLSVADTQHLTVTTNAGVHSGVTFQMSGCHAPGSGVPCSYRGTFSQMLRMVQDLRCIVRGIASDPITATGLTCGTAGYASIGLDPTAKVLVGNAGPKPGFDNGTNTMANFLYCNQSPPAGSQCTYGSAGSAVVDVVSGHSYFSIGGPEQLLSDMAAQEAALSGADQVKPYFTGEGSWGVNTNVNDPALQAAYVPRWYLSLLITGVVTRGYWFAWDEWQPGGAGGLWSPSSQNFPAVQCITVNSVIGGFYCTGATAYLQTVNWLSGATQVSVTCPTSCSNPTAGVFKYNITRTSGYQAQIAWDSSATSPCVNPQCGSTVYSAPGYTTQWRDVTGSVHNGVPTTIGASPIIVESALGPAPASGLFAVVH